MWLDGLSNKTNCSQPLSGAGRQGRAQGQFYKEKHGASLKLFQHARPHHRANHVLNILGGAPQPQDRAHSFGRATAAGLGRTVPSQPPTAVSVEASVRARNLARALWWARAYSPHHTQTKTLRFDPSRALKLRFVSMTFKPTRSEQDQTQLLYFCSRAHETMIHQIGILIHSVPSCSDHDETRLLDCTRALETTIHRIMTLSAAA